MSTTPTGERISHQWRNGLVLAATALTLLVTSIVTAPSACAQETASKGTIKVATRPVPPFAFQDDEGKWRGIAIDLFERIAKDLQLTPEYEATETLAGMLDGVTDGTYAIAVGALSVTGEREQKFDFSHPFFQTGLGIVVRAESGASWMRTWKAMLSPAFLKAVGGLLALLTAVGALIWFAERRRNADQFPQDAARGIGAGLWWSSVTMTTVGYGDKSPETFGGRLIALIWMFVSVIIISTVTASLTTALTVDALSSDVENENDLARVRTGTVRSSTSADRLTDRGIGYTGFDNLDSALQSLANGTLDAVVYDRPLLRYQVKSNFPGKLRVLKLTLEPQEYALAVPEASKLREKVNRGLLKHGRGSAWNTLVTRYLGEEQ